MGVKNLWDILESCKKTLLSSENKRVCIDLSCWIVQLQNVNKCRRPPNDKLYLRGLFHRLRALIALNCRLIFVADGSVPAIKLSTYRRRLNSGSEVTSDESETNTEKVSLRRNMGSEFSCMIKEAKALGSALGVPCLDGIEEGEAQCALLNLESLCVSKRMGASLQIQISFFSVQEQCTETSVLELGEGGYIVCYEMDDIERKLGFGRNSLITLALLLGSDYSQGVYGLGPESACQIVKTVGDDVVLQRIASEGMFFAKKTKNSKKERQNCKGNYKLSLVNQEFSENGSDQHTQRENQFLQVIDAYLKPKCHSADSDTVLKVLCQLPFQRAKLHQICAKFFEWPPEKTDDYILPKIAERELRRFANLRSTLSVLGVEPCLPKCPVKEVVKHRKVQGRECFEVSWENLDGLKTSVVPADLLESACPEKIEEFKERRKPPARLKKSKPKSLTAEIDQKLQALLLEIESDSNTNHSSSFSSIEMTLDNKAPAIKFDAESCHSTCATVAKNEIIDLLSPSPIRFRNVSRSQEIRDQAFMSWYPGMDRSEIVDLSTPSPACGCNISRIPEINGDETTKVIDLSDSETERSPEHQRKARELRLFLASIKEDFL